MCEIQFAISNRNIISGDIRNLLNMGYANGNKDATGVLLKNNGKWTWAKAAGNYGQLLATNGNLKSTIKGANVILGHNRFTTHGTQTVNDNNHPFVVGDWTLIHNGILYHDTLAYPVIDDFDRHHTELEHIETDSFAFFKVFLTFLGNKTDSDNVKIAVERTLELFSGDFSIFIVNTKLDEGYYFKCGFRHFFFRAYENGTTWKILGSTTEENLSYIDDGRRLGLFRQLTSGASFEFVPDKHVLYGIDFNAEKVKDVLFKIDTIKYAERTRTYYESDVDAPTAGEMYTIYPALSDWLYDKKIEYKDIEWIDDEYGYIMHGFTQDELCELELVCESEEVEISCVHGDYVELHLINWSKATATDYGDVDEHGVWRDWE